MATSLVAVTLGRDLSTAGLHRMGLVLGVTAVLLALLARAARKPQS